MTPKFLFLLILFFIIASVGTESMHAQHRKVTFHGTITDDATGETLIGAALTIFPIKVSTVSNEYGYYSITFSESDSVTLVATYVGMEPLLLRLPVDKDLTVDIRMKSGSVALDEVVISTDPLQEKMQGTQMGIEQISAKTSKVLPALFGEVDIIKTLQLKVGVSSGSEGSAGLYVRGGAGDQNLILLDEATVYNANHLFGFFSTFNSDAIKDIRIDRKSVV